MGITASGIKKAEELAKRLGIKLHLLDVASLFHKEVIEYMVGSYLRGLTPNPCVRCNALVKFRIGHRLRNELGFQYVATGHYARLVGDGPHKRLMKGADVHKDQSYFLHQIPIELLDYSIFPLGDLTKQRVRALATSYGIEEVVSKESQEICFISGDYREFLMKYGGESVFRPGDVVDTTGTVIGRHSGIACYTIGQRHGLGIADVTPYYVVGIDAEKNRLIVGKKHELLRNSCVVRGVNYLVPVEDILSQPCSVRLRYRHKGVNAIVKPMNNGELMVLFDEPVSAVTPGQFAVFYRDEQVLGGGEICG